MEELWEAKNKNAYDGRAVDDEDGIGQQSKEERDQQEIISFRMMIGIN